MSTKLIVDGGTPLRGTVAVDSSKNALLPIIAAAILVDGITILKNVPKISDIDNLLHILISLNIKVKWSEGDLHIDTTDITYSDVTGPAAAKIRGSIFVLGAILGRFKTAVVPYPGGCAIGSRPIDLHLQGLRDLGVTVAEKNGLITCKAPNRRISNTDVYLDYPSVGATENLILASVLGKKRVRIINAAREPEVADLCNFLCACGATICGRGTSTITIAGTASLKGTSYTAIPDRINTGSYLIAAAACGGEVTLTNTVPEHNANLINKLIKAGCEITANADIIHIRCGVRPCAIPTVHTAPYPGFPTDLQSQFSVLGAVSKGTSVVTENLFENRFKYLTELAKLGGKVCVKNKSAVIAGVKSLTASSNDKHPIDLYAGDLRGGVALVIAALASGGASVIHNAEYIYRGHAAIERDLVSLGANIIRIDE